MPGAIPACAPYWPGTPLKITCSAASPNALIRRTERASLPPGAKVEWQCRMRTGGDMPPYDAVTPGGKRASLLKGGDSHEWLADPGFAADRRRPAHHRTCPS